MREIAGKYIVERSLGEGGDGQVFLVRHKDLNIKLALKVIGSDVSATPELLEAFKREAEVLFRFSHEGCVQLRDFGSLPDGGYFMAMDYCEGGTLRDLLQRTGRLGLEYAISIVVKILDVLGAAHRLGIIHRDIKPENIMIERDFEGADRVRVLDFGVAHLLELEVNAGSNKQAEFGAAGTPHYMSPEQVLGEGQLDGRADLYSLAIMAYEMLVGKRPFDHDDVVQVLCMQVTQSVEPFPEGFFIPKQIEAVILKALSKSKTDRFKDAETFKRALLEAAGRIEPQTATKGVEGTVKEDLSEVVTESVEMVEPKILILDDDENLLNIFTHIFSQAGYRVYSSTDVSSIHNFLFMNSVELLVTDVRMPDISGIKVCQLIKQALPTLKIILFSNVSERELKKFAVESNADGYLSKQKMPADWLEYVASIMSS